MKKINIPVTMNFDHSIGGVVGFFCIDNEVAQSLVNAGPVGLEFECVFREGPRAVIISATILSGKEAAENDR